MIVVGLTGSIGMGKSTTARMLRRLGQPLWDADATVHRLLGPGGAAVREVLALFPGAANGSGGIDRAVVGRTVFDDTAALARLESILHPKVRAARTRFLAAASRRRAKRVILDIPLLYETGGEAGCDAVIVVTAPAFLQRQRVLSRPGMSEARLGRILGLQLPDSRKRRLTPHVVQTGLGQRFALRRLQQILRRLSRGVPPRGGAFRGLDRAARRGLFSQAARGKEIAR